MIYATEFNPATLQCTAKSADCGFDTIEQVQVVMGIGKLITRRVLLCDGVVFSDFPFCVGEVSQIPRVDGPDITA